MRYGLVIIFLGLANCVMANPYKFVSYAIIPDELWTICPSMQYHKGNFGFINGAIVSQPSGLVDKYKWKKHKTITIFLTEQYAKDSGWQVANDNYFGQITYNLTEDKPGAIINAQLNGKFNPQMLEFCQRIYKHNPKIQKSDDEYYLPFVK